MAGTMNVPNVLANLPGSPATNPVSLVDDNFEAVEDYVNDREITQGTLSARPAAGTAGRLYFATDANGGTLYFDSGATWVQIAFPVGAVGQASLLYAVSLWLPQI